MTTAIKALHRTPELERIYFDALRYCDEREIKDEGGLRRVMGAMASRAFLAAIQPYTKIKAGIIANNMGFSIRHADGYIELAPKLSPAEQKTMDLADELIASEAKRYGMPDGQEQRG